MTLRVGVIVVDARDMARATAFWTAALGYTVAYEGAEWTTLKDPAGAGVPLELQPNPEPKRTVNRVHLDLHASDVESEVARLETLGATRIPWEYPAGATTYVVMADTEGNEFCVVRSP